MVSIKEEEEPELLIKDKLFEKKRRSTMKAMAKLILTKKGDTKALENLEKDARHSLTKDKISMMQQKNLSTSFMKQEDVWTKDIQEKKKNMKKKFIDLGLASNEDEETNLMPFKVNKKWIVSYRSFNKKVWDIGVLVLAVINGLLVPYEQSYRPEFVESPWFKILDLVIDLVFVADIILMFFTSILVVKTGQESFDQRVIAKAYVGTTRFVTDILSILGSQVFTMIHHYFGLFGLFKILRVFRVGSMIS